MAFIHSFIYIFLFLKMRRIPFAQLFILLIVMIQIVIFVDGMFQKKKDPVEKDHFQFEEIEYDDTTEKKDMGKAMKIRDTHFWRELIGKCFPINKCRPHSIPVNNGFGISDQKMIQIKNLWQNMALSADAYVKKWEKNEKWMKPTFLVKGRGELHMSSAMQLIIAMYRDLFKKGSNGKSLKIEMEYPNMVQFTRKTKVLKKNKSLKDNFEDPQTVAIECLSQWIKLQNKDLTGQQKLEIVKKAHEQCAKKLYDIVIQNALDWSSICKTKPELTKKFIEILKNKDSRNEKSLIEQLETIVVQHQDIEKIEYIEQKERMKFEGICGVLFELYKDEIHIPMMEKHPDEMKQFPAIDPCEEAKLKVIKKKVVIKNDKDESSNAKKSYK